VGHICATHTDDDAVLMDAARHPIGSNPTLDAARHTHAEEGKVPAQGVIGKRLAHTGGEALGGNHAAALARQQTHGDRLTQHVGVQRHDQGALVDDVAPQPQVHRAAVPHHPPQEHAQPLARRRRIAGNNHRARKVPRQLAHRRMTIKQPPPSIGNLTSHHQPAQAAIPLKQRPQPRQETAHRPVAVQAIVALVIVRDVTLKNPLLNPARHLAAAPLQHTLNLGEKLLATAIAQARGDERHRLLIASPRHLMHEAAGITRHEVGCLILHSQPTQQRIHRLLLHRVHDRKFTIFASSLKIVPLEIPPHPQARK